MRVAVADLSFRHPGAPGDALSGVGFTLEAGEAVALVGPHGAGKSSLLRILAGFVPHLVPGDLRGRVEVGDAPPSALPPRDRLRRVGILFSDPSSQISGICATVREEVAWGLGNLGVPRPEMQARVDATLERLGLEALAERPPMALSGGQQQRVALAAVLALAPAVVLLDEPVAMLDPAGRHEVLRAAGDLAREGHTVVWATPHLEEAAAFPRWLVLREGRLVADGPAAVGEGHGCLEAPWTRLARAAAARGLWSAPPPVTEAAFVEGLR